MPKQVVNGETKEKPTQPQVLVTWEGFPKVNKIVFRVLRIICNFCRLHCVAGHYSKQDIEPRPPGYVI